MNPSIQIDHLKLTLPPHWRGKARLFARYLSHRLSTLEIHGDHRIDQLKLPPITTQAGESYQAVARRIARQIGDQLNASTPARSVTPDAAPSPYTSQGNEHA